MTGELLAVCAVSSPYAEHRDVRILGFPVRIRPGFAIFMLLIVMVNGVPMGTWLAGSITVFTLAHELGHAVAARRTGAEASIALDFLAGYASFAPTRMLTRSEKATISIAGPAVQIVLGCAVLMAFGVNPLDHRDYAADYWSFAVWWAGPVIGLFNLIPVLPLDGGHIASELVDTFVPGRGRAIVLRISLPVTGAAFGLMILTPELRPLASFAALLFVLQIQMSSGRREVSPDAARLAEEQAWRTGRPGIVAPPLQLSPWWNAYVAANAGHDHAASEIILSDIAGTGVHRLFWWPPEAATVEQLRTVVDLLPAELPDPTPTTHLLSAVTFVDVLRRTGRFATGASWGSKAFRVHACSPIAIDVARCAAALDQPDIAVQWLELTLRLDDDHSLLLSAIDEAPELQSLRTRPDVELIIESISPAS